MKLPIVNLKKEAAGLQDYWVLKQLTRVNNHVVNMAKIQGEFEMHKHEEGEKLFYVIEGVLYIEFPNGDITAIQSGEFVVVPKGSQHKPYAVQETTILFFEAQ